MCREKHQLRIAAINPIGLLKWHTLSFRYLKNFEKIARGQKKANIYFTPLFRSLMSRKKNKAEIEMMFDKAELPSSSPPSSNLAT